MGGLGLWLALNEPDVGQLSAVGAATERGLVPPLVAFPGMAATTVLIGQRALAALVPADPAGDGTDAGEVSERTFGPDAGDLTGRLAAHVRDWDAHGRPSTTGLRIRAYPRATASWDDDASFVIDRSYTRFLVDWESSYQRL